MSSSNLYLKDNQTEPVASSDRIHIENLTGNIYFSPLVKRDEGRYTCQVSNGAGNDTTVGELRVLGTLHDVCVLVIFDVAIRINLVVATGSI